MNAVVEAVRARAGAHQLRLDKLNRDRDEQLAIRSAADKLQRSLAKSIQNAEADLLRTQSELVAAQNEAIQAMQIMQTPTFAAPPPKAPRAKKTPPTPTVEAKPHELNGDAEHMTEPPHEPNGDHISF